jgi:hydrogenase maturation protein HypF
MMEKRINTHTTSSLGRLFDAVAAILNIAQRSQFEGQAAMALEFLAETVSTEETYPLLLLPPEKFPQTDTHAVIVDWEPMIRQILDDISGQMPVALISAKFHNTVADAGVRIAEIAGEKKVALSGGCFQNRYLTEKTVSRLKDAGFAVYWHQRVPPNDGGISLGQAVGAALLNS